MTRLIFAEYSQLCKELCFNIVCQCKTGYIRVEYVCIIDERMTPYVLLQLPVPVTVSCVCIKLGI